MNFHLHKVGPLHPSLDIILFQLCVAELQILDKHLFS